MADKLEAHPKIVWIVLGSGAAGGVVSWVYSITLGLPPVIASSSLAILASIVLGSLVLPRRYEPLRPPQTPNPRRLPPV